MKRLLPLILIVLITMVGGQQAFASSDRGQAKNQPRVTVCHQADRATTVAAPALKAHREHGDTVPGDDIAASADYPYGAVVGPDCQPIPNPEPFVPTIQPRVTATCLDNTVGEFGAWRADWYASFGGTGWSYWGIDTQPGEERLMVGYIDRLGNTQTWSGWTARSLTFFDDSDNRVGSLEVPAPSTPVANPCVPPPPEPQYQCPNNEPYPTLNDITNGEPLSSSSVAAVTLLLVLLRSDWQSHTNYCESLGT